MTLRCTLAALGLALLSGCASLFGGGADKPAATPPRAAPAPQGDGFTLVTPQEYEQVSPTLGVQIHIEAPPELKALLERHLDLVRLGKVTRDDIDDTEWSRLIDATPQQVRELLQTEGYFGPEVTLERAPGRAAGQADQVRVKVVPGVRARISRVTIEVEGSLERDAEAGEFHAVATLAQLRRSWELPSGADFRNSTWSNAKAGALAQLRAAGYANAVWSGTGAQVDVEKNEVRLFVVADSGPLFRLGELQIDGLVVHDTQTVRNLADTTAGTPVTETFLLDFQERLQKAGLFESINVTLDTDPERAANARVVVRLREAPLQVYTFGVGVSANVGPRASVEHYYRRVFGFPASSHNKIEWAEKRQFWEGEISTHTRSGLYRNLLGGTIINEQSNDDTVLSQRLRVGRTQDTARIERLYFTEAERSRRVVTATGNRVDAFALSVNYHGVWRQLDSVVLPTEGFTFAGQVGVGRSHGTNADKGIFQRAYGRLTGYLPFGRDWYGQARFEVGQVFLKPNMVVPESQQWRVGGDDSVRGYSYRSLGPIEDGVVGSGTAMMTASVEVARPIMASMPSLWGAVFVDAGQAANSFSGMKPAVGVGAG
ncbi:MAG: BamA/TamA family outer membrane protein, partial [Rhizobacter sp.]